MILRTNAKASEREMKRINCGSQKDALMLFTKRKLANALSEKDDRVVVVASHGV